MGLLFLRMSETLVPVCLWTMFQATLKLSTSGNKQTTKLNWTVVTPLVSGANTIPAGAVSFNPASTWNLSNDVGASEMVTISLTIPAGQAAGTYIGEWRLHSDSISNNGAQDRRAFRNLPDSGRGWG